jgi:hypothetical protein
MAHQERSRRPDRRSAPGTSCLFCRRAHYVTRGLPKAALLDTHDTHGGDALRVAPTTHPPSLLRISPSPAAPRSAAPMENLDKLTAAGLPVYELNRENLDRKDW